MGTLVASTIRNYLVNLDARLVSSLPQLEVLDISHNFIIALEERLFKSLSASNRLTSLYLQGKEAQVFEDFSTVL